MEIKDNGIAVFDINILGDTTIQSYIGTFEVKCLLSPLDQISAEADYRTLIKANMGMPEEHSRNLAFALTQLKYRVEKFPPFWENPIIGGGHIMDYNVIIGVLNQALEAERQYRDNKIEESKKIKERLRGLVNNKQKELLEEDNAANGVVTQNEEVEEIE